MARRYSAETKAKAAADLAAGMTIKEAAAKHGMSEAAAAKLSPTSERGRVYLDKIVQVKDLQVLFSELLIENVNALRSTVRQAHNATWRGRQSAADLATFYGVVFDKTGKIAGFALAGPALDRAAVPPSLTDGATDDGEPQDAP